MAAQMNRRDLLRSALLLGVAGCLAGIPSPALAAPASTIVLEAFESVPGSGNFDRVRLPSDVASNMGKVRASAMEAASNRALQVAQAQNLSRPKANGLLTRLFRPSLRQMSKGPLQYLVEAGLLVGMTWALTNASIELATGAYRSTSSAGQCSAFPVRPSQITDVGTGTYRSSSTATVVSGYQRTTVVPWSGGTVPAPSGWSWAYQRNLPGGGVEVWFTKSNQPCTVPMQYPPQQNLEDAIPNKENQQANDPALDIGRTMIALWKAAKQEKDNNAPLPGGEVPGEVEEPGVPIPEAPAGPETVSPAPVVPSGIVPADFTNPAPAPVPDPENTHVKFPPEVNLPGENDPTDPTDPTDPETPGTPIDWGTPPANVPIPGTTPMSWFPSMFQPPQLTGTCSGWTIPVTPGLPVTLDPCPLMADVVPVVRPVVAVSATIAAGKILLDI